MKRRTLLVALGGMALVSVAGGQKPAVPKLGVITLGIEARSPYLQVLRQALRELGYVEGSNIAFEYRFADGHVESLPRMAQELVRLNVNLIITESGHATLAAHKATKTIPIVMAVGTNPVNLGVAASLARPRGNVTGVTLSGADRTPKQIQLLKESVPNVSSVAVIYGRRADIEVELEQAKDIARATGIALQFFEVRSPQDLEAILQAVASARPSGMITIGHGMLLGNSQRLAEFSVRTKLPAVFPEREFAEAGGLMAYGPDVAENFRRAATYVDRILKGANPGDLPIEQPTKWGLVVNLRTARALGIKIPGTVLVRADEVFQ